MIIFGPDRKEAGMMISVAAISKEQIGRLIAKFIDKLTPVFKRRLPLLPPVAG